MPFGHHCAIIMDSRLYHKQIAPAVYLNMRSYPIADPKIDSALSVYIFIVLDISGNPSMIQFKDKQHEQSL